MPILMRIFKISMCPRHARKSPESVDIKNVKIGSAVWEILHFGHPDTQTDRQTDTQTKYPFIYIDDANGFDNMKS